MTEFVTSFFSFRFGNVCSSRARARARRREPFMPRSDTYLQVKEAAEFLGVSSNTIRNWGREDKLPEYRHPLNNYRLYRRRDLERLRRTLSMPKRVGHTGQRKS